MSTGRMELRWKNSHQPRGAATRIGRLTATHAASARADAVNQGRSLPARRHRKNSTMSRNAGYSFAAAPRPRTMPAHACRSRDQSSTPTAIAATAIVSKLVKACTATSGDTAMSIASQGRRAPGRDGDAAPPATRVVAHTAISQNSASPTAATVKNNTTSIAAGTPHFSCSTAQVLAIFIAAYWYIPVRTGYSM